MLDLEKLEVSINKTKNITEDDLIVRQLLELCSASSIRNMLNYKSILNNIKSSHFLIVYKELFKKELDDKEIIKDMINGEYLITNLSYLEKSNDYNDEEIY